MDGLKQRIIGAVVLVSLAVIFIPMLFEEPHQQKTTEILEIPQKPEVPAFTIEIPETSDAGKQSVDDLADSTDDAVGGKSSGSLANSPAPSAMPADTEASRLDATVTEQSVSTPQARIATTPAAKDPVAPEPIAESTASVSPPKSATREQGASKAWLVQIGTFRNRQGAEKIRDELRASGTPSYLMDIVSGNVPMVRVYAGPTETRQQAERLKVKVDDRYKLQSLVVTYKGNNE